MSGDKTRAPRTPSGARAESKKGRPPIPLSEEELRRALEGGERTTQIAGRHGCSPSTIRRRVSAARAKHGQGWGVPSAPPALPAGAPRPASHAELVPEALGVLAAGMAGQKVSQVQITCARTVLTIPAPATPPPDGPSSREALLEDLRAKATAITEQDRASAEPLDLDPEREPIEERVH